MVGGGNKRDDGSMGINSTNVFAALESLRRKKKSDKEHGSSKSKGSSKNQTKEPEPQVFWAPAPLTVKSWADVDDDDDYYATTAPPPVWGSSEPQENKESLTPVEESDSEEYGLDEGDDDVEEHNHETEVSVEPEPVIKMLPQASLVPKETERQLSKKELKKRELAELDAVLAELGIPKKEPNGEDESRGGGAQQEKKAEEVNEEEVEKKESGATESKTSKKKKKKEKSSKDNQSNGLADINGPDEAGEGGDVSDMKERLKKVATMKKKKSSKDMDAAAKAASIEAAARSARLAAAKKKEKNNYNQQPVR